MSPPRLVYIVTHPMSADVLLRGQLKWMRAQGWEVTVITNPGPEIADIEAREGISVVPVRMEREIAPWSDARSLAEIVRVLRRLRPDVVNASTPKAGLLGMLAARAASVPVRIYTLRGLRLETTTGIKRALLWGTERISMACAQEVICVSASLRERARALNLAPRRKLMTLGHGSSNGVDCDRFVPLATEQSRELRRRHSIASNQPVIGFVGRLVRDKGVDDLLEAYERVQRTHPECILLLVGPEEEGDRLSEVTRRRLASLRGVTITGAVSDTAPYYRLMTVLAFPSRREGFPNVPLEAAASGVPTVAARATGSVDAVVDGETGLLVPIADPKALGAALSRYLTEPLLAERHGRAARHRAERRFAREEVWRRIDRRYWTWLRIRQGRQVGRRAVAKRVCDLAGAVVALSAAAPVIAATACALRCSLDRGSVFFRQERPGRAGQLFRIVKFRTMTHSTDDQGQPLPDGARLTRVGRLVRSLSLDELPQLWSVLCGDMSFVGPRPLLVEYLDRYTPEQARRHDVLPGITGWAQVHGRNAVEWEKRFALDVWYVDHFSLLLDARILGRTLWTVATRAGVSEPGQATMRRFDPDSDSAGCQDQAVEAR